MILELINDGVTKYGKIIKVPFIVGIGTRCVFLESAQYLSHKASPQKPMQIILKKKYPTKLKAQIYAKTQELVQIPK